MSEQASKAIQLLTPKKNTLFFYSFLPEITKDYFDDSPGVDFDSKLKLSNANDYLLTGSIPTSEIDKFRQGVEITSYKHFYEGIDRGICKIHAGTPGNVLYKNTFGTGKNFRQDNHFKEIEYFDPVEFLRKEAVYTYPVVTGENDETENYNFNGVIEPLTIRAIASFFSIYFPFEAHDIKANLEDGNQDINRASSRIVTVYERNPAYRIRPWLDMIDMIGTVKKIPTTGYFNDDKTFISPFDDIIPKVELSTNIDSVLFRAIRLMSGSTENYIPDGYVSAPCGWMFDDVTINGTDSIAFGGYGY